VPLGDCGRLLLERERRTRATLLVAVAVEGGEDRVADQPVDAAAPARERGDRAAPRRP
jgi:hypothetical protein